MLTTLMSERASVGANKAQAVNPVTMLIELARHLGRTDDPIVRQELMEVWITDFVNGKVNQRATDEREKSGAERGAEGSILKLLGSRQANRLGDIAGRLLGPAFTADTGEWGTYSWAMQRLSAPSSRIAGGTDEVQHNILGERVLGLPKG